jgi:CheY-like chemotaxis protein
MNGQNLSVMENRKLRVLVVDDEPNVSECIRLMLSIDGHDVIAVNSGRAALEQFSPAKFDLVCTDYSMPGMKGDQLAAAIKAIAPGQPVIMISGIASTMSAPAGVDFILGKPFLPRELRAAVTQATNTCEAAG